MLRQQVNSAKTYRVFVFGGKKCGKTSAIVQALHGKENKYPLSKHYEDTIEDTYSCTIETDRGGSEKIIFFDTAGLTSSNSNADTIKNQITYADGIILFYAINDKESFQIVEMLKKTIDKHKDKKELPMVCVGNKSDRFRERQVSLNDIQQWSQRERIKTFEVSATDYSTLTEPLIYLTSRLSTPAYKSGFQQLTRKNRNAAIALEL